MIFVEESGASNWQSKPSFSHVAQVGRRPSHLQELFQFNWMTSRNRVKPYLDFRVRQAVHASEMRRLLDPVDGLSESAMTVGEVGERSEQSLVAWVGQPSF